MKLDVRKPDSIDGANALLEGIKAAADDDYKKAHEQAEIAFMTAGAPITLFTAITLFHYASKHSFSGPSCICGNYNIHGDLAGALCERRRYETASFPKMVLYILLTAAMFCLAAMILFYPPVVSFIDGFVTYDNLLIILSILMFIAFFAAGFAGVIAFLVVVGILVWLVTTLLTEEMILLIGTWGFRIMLSLIPILIAKSGFFHNIKHHSLCFSKGDMVKKLTAKCTNYANTLLLRALWVQEEATNPESLESWLSKTDFTEETLKEALDFAIGYYKSVLGECK